METPHHTPEIESSESDGDIGFIDTGGLAAGQSALCCRTSRAPTATLSIYRNRLVITESAARPIYDFARSDVVRIVHKDRFWLSKELRIIHTRADYPPYVAFSPLNPDQVLDGFQRVGYPVEVD